MENVSLHVLLLALLLFASVSLNRFSKFLKMPILICFLGVGMFCGKYGFDFFPETEISRVQIIGEIALCFIMFSGGLQTSFKAIRNVFVTGTILSTVGVILTAFLTAGLIYFVNHYSSLYVSVPFIICLVAGSVVASTDAAAVFAILRGQKVAIDPKLQSLLEYESGSNDPAAFLLTSITLGLAVNNAEFNVLGFSWEIALGIAWGLGVGAAVGFLVGVAGQWFYNWIQNFLEYDGLRMVIAVAIVLFCYGFTDYLTHSNYLMACYVAGITMGNLRYNYKQKFIQVHDGISWLMQILLFTSLGFFFDYHSLYNFKIVLGAVILTLGMMFLIRPAVVLLCMIGSPFSMKERVFTSWVGIRGSAPIMLSAMVVATLPPDIGFPTEYIFYLVFTTVLLSILCQGATINWAAKKLGLILPFKQKEDILLEYNERSDGSELHNFVISQDNPLVGKTIEQSGLAQNDAVLLVIRRKNKLVKQSPDAVFQANDTLSFLGKRPSLVALHEQFFSDEEYNFSPTFQQAWKDFLENARKNSR